MPLNGRISRWARAKSGGVSARAPPAASRARRVSSAPDIEPAAVEDVDVTLSEAARITGQRMFEAGEREARFGHRACIAATEMRVQHARGKGVARPDAVDDAGDVDLGGLVAGV